jgi:hypothetical protein
MSGHQESQIQSMTKIIDGLLGCIREETAALRSNIRFDLSGSNARKSRLLYELNRAASGFGSADFSPELGSQLKGLRAELAANAVLVKGHVSAVREISDMIINLVRKEETDGTYIKPRGGYAAW